LDIELALVSKALREGQLRKVIDNKITSDFFYGRCKPVYKFMLEHYREYRKTPSVEVIQSKFPDLNIQENLDEPVEYYIDRVRERHKHNLITQGLEKVVTKLEGEELEQAENELYKLASRISVETKVTKDLNYAETAQERWELYQQKKEHLGIDGIPIGLLPVDQITGGAHTGELITILGQPGVGKTWMEIMITKTALKENYRVLFVSKEMEPLQIAVRADAALSGLRFDQIKSGMLGNTVEEKYSDYLTRVAVNFDNLIIVGDDGKGGITDIQAKVEEHSPDILLIDGSYLLIDEEGGKSQWERALNITRGLKRLARRNSIPVYNSTQAGRQVKRSAAPGQEDVGFTYGYAQDSDVLFSIYRSEDMKESGKLGLKLTKVRDGADMGHFVLQWDFKNMETFGKLMEDLTGEEIDEDADTIIY